MKLSEYLSVEEREAARDYLEDKLPWGKLSAEVQQALTVAFKLVEDSVDNGGRDKPFDKRRTTKQVADQIGADEDETLEAYGKLRNAAVVNDLNERMGTDAQLPDPPVSLRDLVEVAVDIHEEKEK